jgi:lysozyme family protein
MSSVQWFLIVRRLFWDVWDADHINSQELAEQIVDFYFHSGKSATREIQKLLHVNPDGIVGPKTVKALKYAQGPILCSQVKRARLDYLLALSKQERFSKFTHGWLRRLVDW